MYSLSELNRAEFELNDYGLAFFSLNDICYRLDTKCFFCSCICFFIYSLCSVTEKHTISHSLSTVFIPPKAAFFDLSQILK